MKKMLSVSVLVMSAALGAPLQAATNLNLPPEITEPLTAAASPQDVAGVVDTAPSNLLPTIFAQANALGVAVPADVLSELINPETTLDRFNELVCAGIEGVPTLAELTVDAALEAGERPDLDPAETIAFCLSDIDTAETDGTGVPSLGGGSQSFVDLPSEAQTTTQTGTGGPNAPGPGTSPI